MSILSGNEIQRAVEDGRIAIDPYDVSLINPVSVDLRLGSSVRMYENTPGRGPLDCRDQASLQAYGYSEITDDGLVLWPGHLYLMHTLERVSTHYFVPILDGKSSIGRLGIQVHMTAGFGDPGFDGQYTLEVTTVYPVRVYAGMRFCQMRFHMIAGEVALYDGNYTGEASVGPVPSRVWKQFKEIKR